MKALKAEGYRVIVVIRTRLRSDLSLAGGRDLYRPITPEIVAKIIEKERPTRFWATMAGYRAQYRSASPRTVLSSGSGSADRGQCRCDRDGDDRLSSDGDGPVVLESAKSGSHTA